MALKEAISHLDVALDLIVKLPQSSERDVGELELRVALGIAWVTFKGWGALAVWSSFYPALALAKSLKDNAALRNILLGLQSHIQSRGKVIEAFQWAEEMLDTAKATGDSEMLVAAYDRIGIAYFWMGRPIEYMEFGDKALALRDSSTDIDYWQDLLGDPKISVGLFGSQAAWMLGYPDRAVQQCDETVAYVRRFGHPFNLGWALRMGAEVFVYRGEYEEARSRSEECERLGKEHVLPVLVALFAPSVLGLALIRAGRFAEGISELNTALAASDASRLRNPYYKAVLGEGKAMLGKLDEALGFIDDAIEDAERPDGGARSHYAEILRCASKAGCSH
jgi:tetratricopeptide (TPR) repeat protein